MKIKQFTLLLITLFLFSGCDVAKQLGGAYNMTQCKYDYNSIDGLSVAGINLSKGITALQILQLTPILTGQASSIPLNFTLNMDISNPNQSAAMLHGLQYILHIDNIQFTSGTINQALNIPAGGKQMLPLTIGVDLATLLKGDTKDAVQNIVKNIAGINDQKSNVTLQIKPTLMIGNQAIPSPVYIPVHFSFGGKK
ncbi:hypothetical protein D0T51_01370 [Parabacteroides sp. 52]|uniref:LEA type 2 family protein n=1 Tax=Parabacteroides sp. 52 TaxID=2302940 RepID=UPI0013D6B994|nr:LEA type 2 family protein [Parabacteroides sp. 52]NDV54385.1 hypothetical protein [Parabacteroides sp. 52]